MGKSSKVKGNSYERKVAKILSDKFLSFTGAKKAFFRQSHSGSMFGGKNRKVLEEVTEDNSNPSDIVSPMGFKFALECKHYKVGPGFVVIFNGTKYSQWDKWLSQVYGDSKASNRIPMLICRYNGFMDEMVFVRKVSWADCGIIDHFESVLVPFMMYKEWFVYKLSQILLIESEKFFKVV